MENARIKSLIQVLTSARSEDAEKAWTELRTLGEEVVPFLEAAYPGAAKWQGRVSLVFHAIPFARTSEAAYRLGLAALQDKSTMVRYRACGLLAYSLRRDALPALRKLLRHPDARTVEDARAAITAIEAKNHHLFVDRARTGRLFWEVGRHTPKG